MESEKVYHTLPPVYRADSRILILGTMPSPKSREYGFYYGHPNNRFWRVMGDLFHESYPVEKLDKEQLLYRNRIALWDVLKSCEISGADDASIKKPVVNDIKSIVNSTKIKAIFTTGTKAASLYKRFCKVSTGIEAISLPSTSPANCRHYTYERILEAYQIILNYI